MSDQRHHELVEAFFAIKQAEDPETYREIADKYPINSARKVASINKREVSVGLLGLQKSHISTDVAYKYGLDSVYEDQAAE